jgi:hypothetical protein
MLFAMFGSYFFKKRLIWGRRKGVVQTDEAVVTPQGEHGRVREGGAMGKRRSEGPGLLCLWRLKGFRP